METAEVRREDRKDCTSRDDEIHRWVEGKRLELGGKDKEMDKVVFRLEERIDK